MPEKARSRAAARRNVSQPTFSRHIQALEDWLGVELIDRSMQMMDGFKWKKFCLGWRFFGWILLAILTCGIGMLWLTPYMAAANAHFYDDLRRAD